MGKKLIMGVAALAVVPMALAGCSSSSETSTAGKIGGTITVLTNRTDVVDTLLKDYAKTFAKKYPGTTVKFEAISNYETDVTTRLSSGNYGDVLLIPKTVTKSQLPQFFDSFGTIASLKGTYRFLDTQGYKDKAYGMPTFGNTMGFVYNKKVWAEAGLKALPTSPAQFLSDLKQIKAKTSATPYYTNYKDLWPLGESWEGDRAMTGNVDESNKLVDTKAPWTKGDYHYIVDGLLFDIVHDGLSEADPTTTSFATSKVDIGSGKIGSMLLGSWAIAQMQDATVTAGGSRDDIGYMPFPYQVNGKTFATLSSNYMNGVSTHSTNKATAVAWAQWFAKDSGYYEPVGGISPIVGSKNPANLQGFTDAGVKFLELAPAPAGTESYENDIVKASQIDLTGGLYRQKLIDIARGAAPGTKDSYFAQLNQQWATAQAAVVK